MSIGIEQHLGIEPRATKGDTVDLNPPTPTPGPDDRENPFQAQNI